MEVMLSVEVDRLMENALLGRLGLADQALRPYVIPLPFCWLENALYLRLPDSGRKHGMLSRNAHVCFEVDWCRDDLSDYASVILEGELVIVADLEEKQRVQAASTLKYERLRGGHRPGHGRAQRLESLPLKKIVPEVISGRKRAILIGPQL